MVNNGTLYYDHDRDGTHTQLAGCEARFRNMEHETYIAIRYENDKLSGILVARYLENISGFNESYYLQFQLTSITKPDGSRALLWMASDYPQATTLECLRPLEIYRTTTILLQSNYTS